MFYAGTKVDKKFKHNKYFFLSQVTIFYFLQSLTSFNFEKESKVLASFKQNCFIFGTLEQFYNFKCFFAYCLPITANTHKI